jgi:DNA-binding HxlR family transcriptional regulator
MLPGVTEKVLTSQLRELARDGVIVRVAEETVPPRVHYLLSDAGTELIPVMEAMCGWGSKAPGRACEFGSRRRKTGVANEISLAAG